MAPQRFAALDLGTNTFRLLIAEPAPSGYRVVYRDRRITRAGGGFSNETGIAPEAHRRILESLRGFRQLMDDFQVGRYEAVATSVFRCAVNRDEVLADIAREAGLKVHVLSGTDEAEASALGAVAEISLDGPAVIFDVGGGSTEYILWSSRATEFRASLEFGVVRLAEDILRSDPPAAAEIQAAEELVAPQVVALADDIHARLAGRPFTLIGTAGTVSTLGAIDLGLRAYDRDRINGHRLPATSVRDNFAKFKQLTKGERLAIPGIEAGREDLIVPGCLITLRTLDAFGCDALTTSEGGLLEGIMGKLMGAPQAPVEVRGNSI